MKSLRSLFVTLCAFAGMAAWPAHSQTSYPSKAVTIKVAYPAGGPADAVFRRLQPFLQRELGKPIIVENVPGAGGSIGARDVFARPADGLVLLGTMGTDLLLTPHANATAGYRADGFKLAAVLAVVDFVLVSGPKSKFKSMADLMAAGAASATGPSVGDWGNGSSTHVMAADLAKRLNIKLLQVPYKGVAPIVTDLIGGHLDMTFMPMGGQIMGFVQNGQLKPLALTNDQRHPSLPNVPTMIEATPLKEFSYSTWAGLFVHADTPTDIVEKLNQAVGRWIASSDGQDYQVEVLARRINPSALPATSDFLKLETEKMGRIVKAINLVPN